MCKVLRFCTCVPGAEKNPRAAEDLARILGIAAPASATAEGAGVVQVGELVEGARDQVGEQPPPDVVDRRATPLGVLV